MPTKDQIISYIQSNEYKASTLEELSAHFSIEDQDKDVFIALLQELEEAGEIILSKKKKYATPERLGFLKGTLKVNRKGFGFLIYDPEKQDLYIPEDGMNGAIDGDVVLAKNRGIDWDQHTGHREPRPEGEVIRVLKRKREQIVGTFRTPSSNVAYVVPDDKVLPSDILIPEGKRLNALDGHKVMVKLIPSAKGNTLQGEITEILGDADAPGMDIISIVRKHGINEKFPEEVLKEAESVPDTISEEEIKSRRDLRERITVTIDGEDAKDLDDAVSVEQLENGNVRLGVHIADVSYYVREGSALDKEAYERGTSVYLVDRVIPMLPKRLSNGICSLNPKVDRLTLTCDVEIDPQGDFVSHDIYESVIRTKERMTYSDVKKILVDQDSELMEKYESLVPTFQLMGHLAETLNKKRMRKGSIDFNIEESKIIVDKEGKPTEIRKRSRTVAEKLIEEFMLTANEVVAEHYHHIDVPFVYRVHDTPDSEKLNTFYQFVARFGHSIKGKPETVKPKQLQELLSKIEGTPEEPILSTIMLRSMKQAKYDTTCTGHFGLATHYYSHFTSPIRRYPDLLIHRVIREMIEKGSVSPERHEELASFLSEAAHHSSVQERIAIDAERETNDLKKAEFMKEHIGEEFDGIIGSVTSFGFFVTLPDTIEGLVHMRSLQDDYYNFDQNSYSLIGERTANVFSLGDAVRIKVSDVNLEERKIDFTLIKQYNPKKAEKKGKKKSFKKPEGKQGTKKDSKSNPRKRSSFKGKKKKEK